MKTIFLPLACVWLAHGAFAQTDPQTYLAERLQEGKTKLAEIQRAANSSPIFCHSLQHSVRAGEPFEADILLGELMRQSDYKANVNASTLPRNPDGTYQVKFFARTPEQAKYGAQLAVANPLTGETIFLRKDFIYWIKRAKK